MNPAKQHIDTLESRIGLMATLAKIIEIDRSREGNEGQASILTDYHYGSLVEAIEIVADSCYGELNRLDDAFSPEEES